MAKKTKKRKVIKKGIKKASKKKAKTTSKKNVKKGLLSTSQQLNYLYSQENRNMASFIKFAKRVYTMRPALLNTSSQDVERRIMASTPGTLLLSSVNRLTDASIKKKKKATVKYKRSAKRA